MKYRIARTTYNEIIVEYRGITTLWLWVSLKDADGDDYDFKSVEYALECIDKEKHKHDREVLKVL